MQNHTYHLKKIKIFKELSEETDCFSAELYNDKTLIALVKNEGQGGGNRYDFPLSLTALMFRNEMTLLDAYIKTLPPLETQYGPMIQDRDLFVDEMMRMDCLQKDASKLGKKLKDNLNMFVLYVKPTGIYKVGSDITHPRRQSLLEYTAEKYGANNVLNLLPFPQALKIYCSVAMPDVKADELEAVIAQLEQYPAKETKKAKQPRPVLTQATSSSVPVRI